MPNNLTPIGMHLFVIFPHRADRLSARANGIPDHGLAQLMQVES
jgi:hypothetical protein